MAASSPHGDKRGEISPIYGSLILLNTLSRMVPLISWPSTKFFNGVFRPLYDALWHASTAAAASSTARSDREDTVQLLYERWRASEQRGASERASTAGGRIWTTTSLFIHAPSRTTTSAATRTLLYSTRFLLPRCNVLS